MEWKNRIVGHAEVLVSTLIKHPHNPRLHPKVQRDALDAAIRELGYIKSVVVNKRTGHVIDGHLRLEKAIADGQDRISVEYVDLSEEEESQAIAIMDPMAGMAQIDAANLDLLLRDFSTDEAAIQEMLDSIAKKAGLYDDEIEEPDTTEPEEEKKWILQVVCDTKEDHDMLLERLTEDGYICSSLVA